MSFRESFDWQHQFLPEVLSIVGPLFIREGTPHEDMKEATDFITVTCGSKRIACRIRRHGYYHRYRDEFTLRSATSFGSRTELDKIRSGWGDYLFYSFAAQGDCAEQGLVFWRLISLSWFRLVHLGLRCDDIKTSLHRNGDGTCFIAYDINSFHCNSLVRHCSTDGNHPLQQLGYLQAPVGSWLSAGDTAAQIDSGTQR